MQSTSPDGAESQCTPPTKERNWILQAIAERQLSFPMNSTVMRSRAVQPLKSQERGRETSS